MDDPGGDAVDAQAAAARSDADALAPDALAAAARLGKEPAPPALVDALLDAAGLRGPWRAFTVATAGRVNTTTGIETADGARLAVRVYGWPFGGEPLFDRRAKEAAWHPRLAAAGVPVPAVLATADGDDGTQAALLAWLDGELLGSVAARDPHADLDAAWREAGAALRRAHGIDAGVDGEGFLTAEGIVAFPEGSFADRIVGELVGFAERLATAAPSGLVDATRISSLATAVHASLAAAPQAVAHSDSNPWNALVERDGEGTWRFRAWLDWEFAWVADPTYDHLRATFQRFADIGPTPETWWEGYGSRPPAAHMEAYAVHFLLWKAVERLDGLVTPETDRTWALLPTVPDRLARLEAALSA